MPSFASSTTSLPGSAEKKSKRSLLRRLSLGKPRDSSSLASISSSVSLASRSTVTLDVVPSEESTSRRAFDLFSSASRRPIVDAYASMPSTPRMPNIPAHSSSSKVSFDTRSLRPSIRSRLSFSSTSTLTKSKSREEDVPPVPEVPKMFLISNEVFIIAAPPQPTPLPRASESSRASVYSPLLAPVSCQPSGSWVDNLGSPSSDETPVFPEISEGRCGPSAGSVHSRSSLDDIDDQLLFNLCEVSAHKDKSRFRATKIETGHRLPRTPRGNKRNSTHQVAPPVPNLPVLYASSPARNGPAPLSLGPLPPQPAEPPTEAVLRKTDQIKKRYSRHGSPLNTCTPLPESVDEATFTYPRPPPDTPKLDSVSSLLSIEAGLSLDSKMMRRNHKRSVSKSSGSRSIDSNFKMPKDLKLTPGHIATPQAEEPLELMSQFSEESDSGSEDARRLFSRISPMIGSVSKMPPFFGASSDAGATDDSRRNSSLSGVKTPDMVARTSSSSSSSYSELSDIASVNVDEIVFDLSQTSLDYRTVYALAQEYAKSSNSVDARSPDMTKHNKKLPALHSGMHKKGSSVFSLLNRSQKHFPDPVDRSYHLRNNSHHTHPFVQRS